jgi:hypothetical protein
MKTCAKRPPTKIQSKLAVIKIYLGKINTDPERDYVPMLPVEIAHSREGNGFKVTAFCDSGSGLTLISDWLVERLKKSSNQRWDIIPGTKYMVEGVDSTGKGVICDKTILLFMKMGSKTVEVRALMVPGLPERLVLGRDLKRATALRLIFGDEEKENRIVSDICQLSHQMISKKEYQKMVQNEMNAAIEELSENSSPIPIRAMRTFVSASKAEIEEIFVTRLPTAP